MAHDLRFNFKSWRETTDRVVAQQRARSRVLQKMEKLDFAGIALPPVMREELRSALSSPHLTVDGVRRILESLKLYESEAAYIESLPQPA